MTSPDNLVATQTRPKCPRCSRPLPTCLCRWVRPCDNQVELVILQHPLEVHHAKGSARLLELSLAKVQRHVGETFDPALLPLDLSQTALLYPLTPDADGAIPKAWDLAHQGPPQHLLLLDGTWRKSRKLLHLNPWLRTLPRWPLLEPPPSRYRIRKAARVDQLSTLEAGCLALQQLEQRVEPYAVLLESFVRFVDGLDRTPSDLREQLLAGATSAPTGSVDAGYFNDLRKRIRSK